MGKKTRKELQTVEAFEKALREEMEISLEFDLPLTVLALVIEGGWQEEDTRRALDALRTADLVARPDPRELLIALPNTITADARVVEERLRRAVSKATIGVAPCKQGETAEGLLKRAQAVAWRAAENPPEATSC
jgi:hypothetical protein